MSRLGANLIFLLTVVLLAGAAGWLIAKRRLTAEIVAVQSEVGPELSRLRGEHRELRQKQQAATPQAVVPPGADTASTPALAPAKRSQIISDLFQGGMLGRQPWPQPDRNSLLAGMNDVASILGLNREESGALQRAAETARQEFAAALAAHTTVERAGSMVTLTVPNHPDILAPYDRMLAGIATLLGPERYRAYETFGASDAIAKVFDRWGRQGTVLKIAHAAIIPEEFYPVFYDAQGNPISRPRSPVNPSGRVQYYYTQLPLPQPGSSASSRGGSISGIPNLGSMEANVGPLHALVPSDF